MSEQFFLSFAKHSAESEVADDDVSESVYPKRKTHQRINEVSFAVNDILLYLDTHPCCQEALAFYQECAAERRKLM